MHPSLPGARTRRSVASVLRSSLLLTCGVLLALGSIADSAFARRGEEPLAPVGRGSIGEPALRVAAPDVSLLVAEDKALQEDGQKTLRYAESIAVRVSPSTDGRWEVLSDGTRVWRMEVVGPGATDLNLGFGTFEMPYGAKLWVISTEADYYEGPYTHEDNEEHGQLWVPVVPGARAIVELQVPAQTKFEPRLEMTHVGYGYKDVFSMNGLPKQGSCNNDVVCPEGDPWRDQIQAVAVYSLGGSLFCSGQMVMDADSSFRPFFLTAYHCGLTAANAPSLTVFWNFESPTCGALSGGSLADNQTGAVFRTRRQDVDMCLVELDDFPDPTSEVFYSGWDRSGDVPQGSVGIHHPNTDEKAISFNDDPLGTQGSCIVSGTSNTHWLVDNWEDGTTEPGSSGSGLWDPDTKLLVGFLSGGLASCTNINYDCYGKFSVAWDGSSASTRLSDWLDPSGTGALQVQGSFPSGDGVLVHAGVSATDDCQGSSDGVIEPGETVNILVGARAVLSDVTGISGVLTSSSPGVSITTASANWPDIAVGVTSQNSTAFEVSIDASVPCFSEIQFSATLTDVNGGQYIMPFSLNVGQVQSPAGLPLAIPDGSASGVTSSFTVAENVSLTDLDVRVQIDHTWVGDLRIQLRSPAGTLVTLLDRPGVPASTYGCSDDDLDIVFDDGASQALESYCAGATPWYSGTALPTQALAAFNGESTAGTWQLIVADFVGADTGNIVDWQLLTTPGIGQGICEPCENAVATTLQASTVALQRVSVMVVPDGSGDRLDDAQLWDGVPGSLPSRVDATVTARVETAFGDPVDGFGDPIFLSSSEGNLALCPGAGIAGAETDANGETTFSGAIAAGGSSDLELDERILVTATGLTTVYSTPPGLEITFNSPDFNGDGAVDLVDVGTFAPLFTGGAYDYAADFAWDGELNLGDLGVFSTALGVSCAVGVAKAPSLAVASGTLGIVFDVTGSVTAASLPVGEEIDAFVVLRGEVARTGIHGWEAALRTSDNVRVIGSEVMGNSLDLLGAGVFAVGATAPGGLRDADGTLVLARVRLAVTDDAPAHLYLDASPVASRGAESPVVLIGDGETAALAALTRTEAPVASLNDPLGDAPGANLVTKASLTNVPNPFNPSTEIKLALPQTGRVEIRVYDVSGRLVRSFDLGEIQAGEHSTVWRGEDQNGREVVSGVYFSKLYVDGVATGASRKMSLLK